MPVVDMQQLKVCVKISQLSLIYVHKIKSCIPLFDIVGVGEIDS